MIINETDITKGLLVRKIRSKDVVLGIISRVTTFGLYELTYIEGRLKDIKTVVTVEDLMKVNTI
jgi:hypothetical protein